MAGRNQHTIPQSLLRGFGTRRGKETYVTVYHRERGVFAPSTRGIAAERLFYSDLRTEGDVPTLDERITDYENARFDSLLQRLRASAPSEPLAPEDPAEFVTHLSVRTAHFRDAGGEGAARLLNAIGDLFRDRDFVRWHFGLDGSTPAGAMREQLDELWQKHEPELIAMGFTKRSYDAAAFAIGKAAFENNFGRVEADVHRALSNIEARAAESAQSAQRQSLDRNLVPPLRMEKLQNLHWRVDKGPSDGLILPDCVVIGIDDGGANPLAFSDPDSLAQVLLPLSHDRLLVGKRDKAFAAIANPNELLSSCAWDFFVARDRTADLDQLRPLIRTATTDLFNRDIGEALAAYRGGA